MAEVNAVEKQPVTKEYLKKMDAYWRAANYLGAAQLYLLDNPLLREPLTMDRSKVIRILHSSVSYMTHIDVSFRCSQM